MIRPERAGDAAAVRALVDAAFAPSTDEGRIVDDLRAGDRWLPELALVAVDAAGRVVGQSVTSRADFVLDDGGREPILALGPIAVIPDRQGEGIGEALLAATAERATTDGWPVIVLLGHATYYPRFGYEPARPLGIEPQRPWSDEHWLALRLPGWTPGQRGTLRYPDAFRIETG
jgi:predicted N-acetyltransferase YhbS